MAALPPARLAIADAGWLPAAWLPAAWLQFAGARLAMLPQRCRFVPALSEPSTYMMAGGRPGCVNSAEEMAHPDDVDERHR